MLRNLVILIAVTVLISIGLGLLFERVYPFVLASETARTSIVVTPEQTLELRAAARASDMIAFAIFAAVACGGIAVCLGKPLFVCGFPYILPADHAHPPKRYT